MSDSGKNCVDRMTCDLIGSLPRSRQVTCPADHVAWPALHHLVMSYRTDQDV